MKTLSRKCKIAFAKLQWRPTPKKQFRTRDTYFIGCNAAKDLNPWLTIGEYESCGSRRPLPCENPSLAKTNTGADTAINIYFYFYNVFLPT